MLNRPILFVRFVGLIAVVVLHPGVSVAHASEAGVNLRPEFVEGRESRYSIWLSRQQTQSVFDGRSNQAFDTRFELDGEVSWRVERVRPDGSAVCEMVLEWMATEFVGPTGDIERSDSRRKHGQPEVFHQMLRAMVGVPIHIEVGRDGTVLGASGIDAIRRKAPQEASVPDELDFIESAYDLVLIANAPEAAVVNDAWDWQSTRNHQLGSLEQRMRYTLDSVEEIEGIPVATVIGRGDLSLDADIDRLTQPLGQGIRANARMVKGQIETQVMYDLQRHEAVGRNSIGEQQIEINLHWGKESIKRTLHERIQSQTLRLQEQ